MQKLKAFFVRVANEIKDIVLRFPGVVFFMIIYYLVGPLSSRSSYIFFDIRDLSVLSIYGMLLTFLLEIVLENLKQKRARLRLICYGVIVVLLLGIMATGFFSSRSYGLGCALGFIALGVLVVFAFSHKDRGSLEKNCVVLFVNWVKALAFSLLFIVGVELLLYGIEVMFELRLEAVREEIIIIGMILLQGFIFLAGVPRIGDELKCPKFLEDTLKYICVPTALGWSVLWILYTVKDMSIVVPGLLSETMLTIAFAVGVSIFAKIVENEVMEKARRVLAILVIPLLIATVWLAGWFYMQEGIVLTLYLAVIECVVAAVFVVGILFRNSKYQNIGFLVLAIFLALGSVGPLSAGSLIQKSQQRRITTILNKYNMIKDNKIVDAHNISQEDIYEVDKGEACLNYWNLEKPDYYGDIESMSEFMRNINQKGLSEETVEMEVGKETE